MSFVDAGGRAQHRGNGSLRVHQTFGYLDQEKRWEILAVLCKGAQSVSGVARILELDVSDISRQLSILRKCGLVTASRYKKEQRYRIASTTAVRLRGARLTIRVSSPVDGAVHAMMVLQDSFVRRLSHLNSRSS